MVKFDIMLFIYRNKNIMEFDIKNKEHAYVIGLLQADGHFSEYTRNRGRVSLELSIKDKDILEKIDKILTCNSTTHERTRDIKLNGYEYTGVTSSNLSFFDLDTRESLKKYLPISSKSSIIEKPDNILEIDYWRGIIDGDGSIGITKNGYPFISLITCSEKIAIQYIEFLEKIIGYKKKNNRNKRDNAYNIVIFKEDSQKLAKLLYYDNCLSIDRKYNSAMQVIDWVRPTNMKKRDFSFKKWSTFEDDYIIEHTVEESMQKLDRTEKSIKTRLWRLQIKK